MKIGIIGLPQTGKKLLFNLLTDHKPNEKELSQNKPVRSLAEIKDPRFDTLVEMYKPRKEVRARIDIELLPKLEQDSIAKGDIFEEINEVDAICHVVRAFTDDAIYHAHGSVNPVRDIDAVNSELILHDLIFIEKRFERSAKAHDTETLKERETLAKLKTQLDQELPLRLLHLNPDEEKIITSYPFITRKKMIIVVNVSEDNAGDISIIEDLTKRFLSQGIFVIQVSAKVESEIAGLDSVEEKAEFMQAIGIKEPAIDKLTRVCLDALNLISFFTVGSDEVRQWTLRSGSTAPEAAGVIHTDLQKGFIRAEVMKYADLIELGDENKMKEAGKMLLKGKDYIVEDGDILNIRFNV